MTGTPLVVFSILAVAAAIQIANLRVLREYQRGVVFRLGRLHPLRGPGLVALVPLVDRMVRVDLRIVTLTIPPQEVTTVEIKDVEIPEAMQRAMARQAEAERERRAKIINAEGEFQASHRLHDASEILSRSPAALQLRYLQTLLELGTDQNSTIVFPLPLDLIRPFLDGSLRFAPTTEPP
ncbi:MAG: SPFH domain-containing protein [Pseudonocardiaceae bacterium]